MQTHLQTYLALGAEPLVIVGQRAAKVEEYRRAQGLTMTILVDPERSVIKQYGVYHRIGLTAYNIARAATFMIDQHQALRFIHIGQGQRDRPDHETLVAELERLRLPRRS